MKSLITQAFVLAFSFGLLSACSISGPEQSKEDDDFYGSVEIPDSMALDSDEVKVYTLPTPLQVATALYTYQFEYLDKALLPVEVNYSTNFKKSLNLGMQTIDLGYTMVYNHRQKSLDYLENVKNLMADLGIRSQLKEELIERFKSNIENPDSLSAIILKAYETSHLYFQSSGREGLGLLILTGCYLEGLHIATSNTKIPNQQVFNAMIAQQKMFLENIIELLAFYVKADEIATLKKKLNQLLAAFEGVKAIEGTSRLTGEGVTQATLKKIRTEVDQLRQELIS